MRTCRGFAVFRRTSAGRSWVPSEVTRASATKWPRIDDVYSVVDCDEHPFERQHEGPIFHHRSAGWVAICERAAQSILASSHELHRGVDVMMGFSVPSVWREYRGPRQVRPARLVTISSIPLGLDEFVLGISSRPMREPRQECGDSLTKALSFACRCE
jgi:hypothetical protein